MIKFFFAMMTLVRLTPNYALEGKSDSSKATMRTKPSLPQEELNVKLNVNDHGLAEKELEAENGDVVEGKLVDSNADDMSDMIPRGLSDDCQHLLDFICSDPVCQAKCLPLQPNICSNKCKRAIKNRYPKKNGWQARYSSCLHMVWANGEDKTFWNGREGWKTSKSDVCEYKWCSTQRPDVCKKQKGGKKKKPSKKKGMLEQEHMIANGSRPDDATSLDEALAGKRSC